MTTAFFEQQRSAQQRALAVGLGCSVNDFVARERLTIVERAEVVPWPYTALIVTFGLGAVLSVAPGYREVVERLAPAVHYHALRPAFLQAVVDEARSRGRALSEQGSSLGWALSAPPPAPDIPAGFSIRVEDVGWMTTEMPSARWPNGLGFGPDGDTSGRQFRNRYAAVVFDSTGTPAAVGGVFSTWGLSEIGVDVAPEYQARGLGRLVVQAAARAILERGEIPLYGCALDNIRSQRTALSCGFLPSYSDSYVFG